MKEIIIAAIPTIGTIILALINRQGFIENKMLAAKQRILQLILEDEVHINAGKLPTNYQLVLEDYDVYKKCGGNSYIEEKVKSYKELVKDYENK